MRCSNPPALTTIHTHARRFTLLALSPLTSALVSALVSALAPTLHAQTTWSTIGNSGLVSGSYIGTNSSLPLELRTNSTIALRLSYAANTSGDWSTNVLGGFSQNRITTGSIMATIGGGGGVRFGSIQSNAVTDTGGTIAGGAANIAGLDNADPEDAAFTSILGGYANVASANFAAIGGGFYNNASGEYSVVPGGYFNTAGGLCSFAGGYGGVVRDATATADADGDEGTFLWSDSSSKALFESTGPNQFLVRAAGGMGVGTNAPTGLMEVAGNGSFNRAQLVLTQTTQAYCRISLRSAGSPRYWTLAGNAATAGAPTDRLNFYHASAGNVMSLTGDGKVGIGTSTPGSFRLAVNGDAAKPGGGSWSVFCDPRLKENIAPMRGTLDTLLALHGYEFAYTPEAVSSGRGECGRQIGLMADEVERVFPAWVSRDDEGYRFVSERATTALMVEALRDLRSEKDAQIETLRREVASKDALLAELAARVARLEASR